MADHFKSGFHLNGNMVCAIDTETTGLIPGQHDITEIAVIPLLPDWTRDKSIMPFHVLMQPKRPGNWDPKAGEVTGKTLEQVMQHGMEAWAAVDRFEEWFDKLRLPERKQIIPLGMNYLSFDYPFIVDWLGGYLNYRHYFRSDVRDVMLTALHHNDRAEWRSESVPYSKTNLQWLCTQFGILRERSHTALEDAMATAECYRRLLKVLAC